MMLEDDLRTTLAERAAEPAVQPDLLGEVRTGIRRSNRRRAAVLGAAALLVAAIAVPVVITRGRAPAPGPVPLQSAPADQVGGWQRPRLDPPTFPLTPGWTPSGLGEPRVGQLGSHVLLSYQPGPDVSLQVEVGNEPGSWESEGERDVVTTVSGRPAMVRTGSDRYVGVRWQLADLRWVQLISSGSGTESEVLRFARGLRLQTLPVAPVPFTVATAPAGLGLQLMVGGQMCLAPPALRKVRDGGRGLCLNVVPPVEAVEPDREDERLTIGGRPATLASTDEGPMTLTVPLTAGRQLTVDVTQEDVPLTREQLIRFAEGVTVNG